MCSVMLAFDPGPAETSVAAKPQQEGLLYNIEFDHATGSLQACEACVGKLVHPQLAIETCLMHRGGICLDTELPLSCMGVHALQHKRY